MNSRPVRHQTGTVDVEGAELVGRLGGTCGVFRSKPWSEELRWPVADVDVRLAGSDLVVRSRSGRPLHAFVGVDVDAAAGLVEELEGVRRPRPADCDRCGAPGQLAGRPCSYCGGTVSPPRASTIASAARVSSSGRSSSAPE